MRTILKRTTLLLLLGVAIAGISAGVVYFTGVCRLEAVTLDGESVGNWSRRFDMLRRKSLVRQPLDSLARVILAEKGTYKVDLSCSWPHTLEIKTNDFSPTCFLLEEASGWLRGVEKSGRIVPLQDSVTDWEKPVLTGVQGSRLFHRCRDVRVGILLEQLEELRTSNLNLFRLVEEIDLETNDYVQVSVSGVPYRLRVYPERFASDLGRFIEFVTRFDSDLSGIRYMDMRFQNMIICARGKN